MVKKTKQRLAVLTFALTLTGPAAALPVYNEALNGDFSNNRGSPTVVPFAPGQNDVFGQTGRSGGVTDLDYFTFTIPTFSRLTSVTVLNLTLAAGGASFLGLQAGAVITVDPAAPSAAPLLGYHHLAPADIGVDILPQIGTGDGSHWESLFKYI